MGITSVDRSEGNICFQSLVHKVDFLDTCQGLEQQLSWGILTIAYLRRNPPTLRTTARNGSNTSSPNASLLPRPSSTKPGTQINFAFSFQLLRYSTYYSTDNAVPLKTVQQCLVCTSQQIMLQVVENDSTLACPCSQHTCHSWWPGSPCTSCNLESGADLHSSLVFHGARALSSAWGGLYTVAALYLSTRTSSFLGQIPPEDVLQSEHLLPPVFSSLPPQIL